MFKPMNQQILLKSYPTGAPQKSDFALVETAIPELGDKEVLNHTIYSQSRATKPTVRFSHT